MHKRGHKNTTSCLPGDGTVTVVWCDSFDHAARQNGTRGESPKRVSPMESAEV